MLKTHAEGLKTILFAKESRHLSLRVEVIPGIGRKDFRVRVNADELLINDIMDEMASGEYLDNSEQTRRRLGPTSMEFY